MAKVEHASPQAPSDSIFWLRNNCLITFASGERHFTSLQRPTDSSVWPRAGCLTNPDIRRATLPLFRGRSI